MIMRIIKFCGDVSLRTNKVIIFHSKNYAFTIMFTKTSCISVTIYTRLIKFSSDCFILHTEFRVLDGNMEQN